MIIPIIVFNNFVAKIQHFLEKMRLSLQKFIIFAVKLKNDEN
jgi:hypothetical protein